MDSVIFQIFWVFFKIGFLSFGGVVGVLPELERMVVFEHGWISSERFVQAYVMGQFLPGPNMAMCPIIGFWTAGIPGAIAAFFGIYTAPVLVMSGGWFLYSRGREKAWVKRAERSARPVLIGLFLAAAVRLWWVQTHSLGIMFQFLSLSLVFLMAYLYQKKKVEVLLLILLSGFIWLSVRFALRL